MSRSYKQNPYINTCGAKAGTMKFWKKTNERILRKEESPEKSDLPSGSYYKKINDAWCAPNDGKHYWDNPKAYRK